MPGLIEELEAVFQDFTEDDWLDIKVSDIPWDLFPKLDKSMSSKRLIIRAEAVVQFFYENWTESLLEEEFTYGLKEFPLDGMLSRLRMSILLNTLGIGNVVADLEYDDEDLPFNRSQLDFISDDEQRTRFLDLQKFFLLDASPDDYPFMDDELPPFVEEEILGRGSLGTVTKVSHVFSGKQYARRRFLAHSDPKMASGIPRVKKLLDQLKEYPGNRHIAQVEGSYVRGSKMSILQGPVADCNLSEYLEKFHTFPDQEKERSNLYRLLGCLCVTLKNMHKEVFTKKSIKPRSILIHGSNVLFTGFHVNAPFIDDDDRTPKKYEAPELWFGVKSDLVSDVFSLGCVFLEVVTVLAGKRLEDLEKSIRSDYNQDIPGLQKWLQHLVEGSDDKRLVLPLRLCSQMVAEREARPEIGKLIVELVADLPQDVPLKEYFCVDCSRDLALLALDRLASQGKLSDHIIQSATYINVDGFSC